MATLGKRYFGLDLLRSLAVTPVIFAHYGPRAIWGSAGFAHEALAYAPSDWGVDAFFILSGYLIGTILLKSFYRSGATFKTWGTFMVRRIMRIAPPYYLCVIIVFLTLPPHWTGTARYVEYLTYTQNLAWPLPGYLPLTVTWSLTVEMWFYLLFSALAIVVFKRWGLRGVVMVLLGFLILPAMARASVPLDLNWGRWVRGTTLLRMDAIPYGVVVALLMFKGEGLLRNRGKLAIAGGLLTGLVASWWIIGLGQWNLQAWFPRTFITNGFLLGTALLLPWLICVECTVAPITRFFAWFSDISYTVYLVHVPVLLWMIIELKPYDVSAVLEDILALLATILVATCSLYFLERPILARRPKG